MRATLPKIDSVEGSQPCGKGTWQLCDNIIRTNTFPKVCEELLKIQSGPLDCNLENVFYLLRVKFVMMPPMLERLKQSSTCGLITIKVNIDLFKNGKQNVPQIRFPSYYWEITLFQRCETHERLKERVTF